MPIPITGLGGAFSVVAVNSWMNQPQGFSPTTGEVTKVEPLKVIFNPAVPYEVPHMILAAYLVTGFLVASVYAVGMLRGRRDRYHRLGLLIPLTVACIATPIQFAVGDTAARAIAEDQPIKFAAMECVQTTATHVTEYIYGRCTADGVKGGIGIPGFDSFLVGWSTDTQVIGLDTVPPDDRPPANTMLHWAFDTMVGICTMLIALGLWLGVRLVAQARHPADEVVPARGRGVGRVASVVALECGWIVTEVGRQPWIVYNVMRTEDAVTQADGVWVTFVARRAALRGARRRARGDPARDVAALARRRRGRLRGALRPVRAPVPAEDARMSSADAVAAVLWTGVTAYAVFGGADFGAGFWSLVAGGGERGRRARELIDWAIGPVWEANHVWLIFVLVVLWTGFSAAFESIFSTLFIPLSLAALGHRAARLGVRVPQDGATARGAAELAERLFGLSSLLTPFFMGTVVGADRVGQGAGRQRHRRSRHQLAEPALAA